MSWSVLNITLKQQQCGPIRNIIVLVTAKEDRDTENRYDQVSKTFTVDDKVNVFFKLRFRFSKLILYVNIQKIESVQNCNVEITCQEFRKVTSCSKEWSEVELNPIKPEEGHGQYWDLFFYPNSMNQGKRDWRLYIIEVNITVHEMMSMSIPNKLYEDTEFTDFQLKAADGAVAVHKSILAFQSDVFKTMLKGEWKETVEGCINIDGVTIKTLQFLKDYMYLSTLPDEGLEPLILLADHYLMDKLKSECITKLVKSVKPEDFDRIVKFAYQSGLSKELVSALICVIPDDVANSIYQLKNNKTESTESNDEN